MSDVVTQIERIRRGVAGILREEELGQKLERSLAACKPLRVKLGVDPTAPDIHLGHTVVLRKLRQFQDLGHQAVLIIGDYTAMVGDPSGKSRTRPQLSMAEIQKNAQSYLDQVGHILDVSRLEIVRNGDWFRAMSFGEVLRLAARMTVSRMLERDDFRERYQSETPIGLHEFLYPLMQGYDSLQVRADVELGGTDQTFNLLVGRELQRDEGIEPQVCITLPLLLGLDGTQKMSKSLKNYVGVHEPPRDMFGKLMSLPDALMRDYFSLLTDLGSAEIDGLLGPGTHPRDAKQRLAEEIVAAHHGQDAARHEAAEFRRVFSQRQLPSDAPDLRLDPQDLSEGQIGLLLLLRKAGFASSNSDARRLIIQGGVSLDGETICDPNATVAPRDGTVLRAGKWRFARLRR
jgi:tyrosyl-tRNA synthetase